ncbi:uncharacterized protein PGTG_15208 [Puccinia graminis f. sp. tritici CRL 75-36-700-3]|uniref:RING-type domain-containing protein n=1 Tax=Puccinia graminis f. sp. tritici (strain CRL 75-36-700-3 / race SCCL) TaxID=418459 RepID=E3KXD2_PUCGT|nr:uncharacterized protein PGTG_15208 [Puccinia graminis f. sp. tritici CRL 75-36-700-3]EFP89005.2 hypothetical protein PGTG_15208 [Puccinia graminis f. sp. tritici CRL 75-36-700-3]
MAALVPEYHIRVGSQVLTQASRQTRVRARRAVPQGLAMRQCFTTVHANADPAGKQDLCYLFGVSSLVYGSPVGDEVRSQESMSLCSICTSAISNSQEMFKSPTCTEGHTAHKACVDPRYIEASSCPACQDARLAEQDARLAGRIEVLPLGCGFTYPHTHRNNVLTPLATQHGTGALRPSSSGALGSYISFQRSFLANQASRADCPELQGVPIVSLYHHHLSLDRMDHRPISPHAQ